jgi:hypothetical protein
VSYSRPDAHYTADHPPQLLTDPRYNFLPGEAMGIVSVGGVTDMGPSANFPRAFAGKEYTASNDTNISAGRSSWKFGVRVNRVEQFVQQAFSRGGQASFANVTAFLQGLPNFTRAPSPGSSNSKTLTYTAVGVYAQNDFKASDRLTLNLGLRYEPQTRYKEKFGRESAIRNILTDPAATLGPLFKNNTLGDVSPRFGFAWDVRGNGRTAVRGAAARLYDLGNMATPLVQAVAGTPPFSSLSRVNNAPFTVPFELPAEGTPQALRIIDYNLAAPNMWHYNVAVERELIGNMALTVAYAGSRGINLIRTAEGNPRNPSQTLADGRAFWTGLEPRVSPYWNTIELKVADSKSQYNSLQLKLNQRLSRGLQFQNSLTWASARDTYSSFSNTDTGGAEGQAGGQSFRPGPRLGPRGHRRQAQLPFQSGVSPARCIHAGIGRRGPSQHMAGRDDRAGHVRAAVHARADDQPLKEWRTWGAGRDRPAGSHTRGSAQGRHEGCLARMWRYQGGNACRNAGHVVRSVRLHDSTDRHAGERAKKWVPTSRLFTGRYVIHEDDSRRQVGAH